MIKLSRLNKTELVVNAELIETIESTPDSVVTLTTGKKLVVLDSTDEIIAKVIAYRLACSGRNKDLEQM
ncbi:flagellar FlbD family protein [Heliobacterium chlorum]|uniref:Flagellar FlbD family protein n=1 Tax=Heliobacterium chlorum TaxID=2698 RepID=A0ABR7SY07_HELCL|nr:flagellar FlbD family protein [Heliobacterium chlorum]MBC9783422.1 flagellar FlbD family protein [Heliobacterium chlorum]